MTTGSTPNNSGSQTAQSQAANTQQNAANTQNNAAKTNTNSAKILLNGAKLIVQAAIKIASISYEKDIENISNFYDTTITKLEAMNKISQQGVENIVKSYTSAIHVNIGSIVEGVNEGAYAAANSMVDLASSISKFELDKKLIEQESDFAINLRKRQNEATIENLENEQKVAVATVVGESIEMGAKAANGAEVLGFSLGNAPGYVGEIANNGMQIAAGTYKTIVELENKIAIAKMEGEQKVLKLQLENAVSIKKAWIDAGADIQKAWLEMSQNLENKTLKSDSNANSMGIEIGLSGEQLERYKKIMFQVQESIAYKWGKTLEDIHKIQSEYIESTGRNIQFSQNDMNETIANSLLYGEETIMQMNAGAEILGVSIENSNDLMFEMYKQANKMGLNAKAYGKTLVQSLKVAEKYQFKDGIKGLASMAKWAAQTRFNMQNLDSMISSIHEGGLQGIIEKSANLQVLGGNFAMNSDPLRMAWESYMNPAGLAKRYNRMLDGIGYLDSNGELVTGVADQMRLEEFAKQTGQSINDVRNQIRQTLRGDSVSKNLSQIVNWSEEQKALITNKAFKNENGQWVVKMNEADENGNWERNVSELTAEDLQHLYPQDNEEKLVQYVLDIRDWLTKLNGDKEGRLAKLQNNGFETAMSQWSKRMINVSNDFNDKYEEYLNKYKISMNFATESQRTFEDIMKRGNSNIDEANEEILSNAKKIAITLESVNDIIKNAILGINSTNGNYDVAAQKPKETPPPIKEQPLKPVEQVTQTQWKNSNTYSSLGQSMSQSITRGVKTKQEYIQETKQIMNDYENGKDISSTRLATILGKIDPSYNKWGLWYDDEEIYNDAKSMEEAHKHIEDGAIFQNGEVIRIDDNDEILAAKNGGPIDKIMDSIYNTSDMMYNQMGYDSYMKETPNSSKVILRPMRYDSYVRESPNSNGGGQGNSNGKIEVAPIQININGSIQLSGANGTMDITQQIANDPNFIRSLSQMISLEVEKKVHGGRVNNVLDRGLQF